jgi:S1-C subfamily serine protease
VEIDSIAKRLLFSTVRVDTELEDGSQGSGTAFIITHSHAKGTTPFVVTNRHLVEGVRRGGLVFTRGAAGRPALGQRFQLNIEEFPAAWFFHPDASVDLALVPLRPLERAARALGVELYYHAVDSSRIPDAATTRGFDALEDVLFVGYPSGVWDHVNLMPILRRGTTATPLELDFEGHKQFLIDAAVYPGSSGSPVFVMRSDARRSHLPNGRTIWFAGVIAAVFFREEPDTLVPRPVPTHAPPRSVCSEMIDLGLVIKSESVREVIEVFLREWMA